MARRMRICRLRPNLEFPSKDKVAPKICRDRKRCKKLQLCRILFRRLDSLFPITWAGTGFTFELIPIQLTSNETQSRIRRLHSSALWGGADSAWSWISFFTEVCGIGTGWGGRLIQCRFSPDHCLCLGTLLSQVPLQKDKLGRPD